MGLEHRLYLAAATADLYGTLEERGHKAATRAMVDVLNSMIGSRSLVFEGGDLWTYFLSWENLAVFTGERPSVKVTIRYSVEHAIWKRTFELEALVLRPHNIPAMEVMWS